MSRKTQEVHKSAHQRWPDLAGFLISTLHGRDDRLVQEDVETTLSAMSLGARQQLAREWWTWNATAGAVNDVRFAVEAFDSGMAFDTAEHARAFMNDTYDRIITSIRRETGAKWKP